MLGRKFYSIDGFPVIVIDDPLKETRFALVPNPVTGFWETDQRFLNVLNDQENHIINEITPHKAGLMAEALVQNIQLRQLLERG